MFFEHYLCYDKLLPFPTSTYTDRTRNLLELDQHTIHVLLTEGLREDVRNRGA